MHGRGTQSAYSPLARAYMVLMPTAHIQTHTCWNVTLKSGLEYKAALHAVEGLVHNRANKGRGRELHCYDDCMGNRPRVLCLVAMVTVRGMGRIALGSAACAFEFVFIRQTKSIIRVQPIGSVNVRLVCKHTNAKVSDGGGVHGRPQGQHESTTTPCLIIPTIQQKTIQNVRGRHVKPHGKRTHIGMFQIRDGSTDLVYSRRRSGSK